jgi:glycosyltransferase involved in cell wall biosynthesis
VNVLLLAFIIFLSLIFAILTVTSAAGLLYREEEDYGTAYEPKTLVIVPCKGRDVTLKKNLVSLKNQAFRDYDIIAVVDNTNDEALPTIRELGIKYMISSKKYKHCSGKVAAISTALSKAKGHAVCVIIDSDVECSPSHLKYLVAPLKDRGVGISTAYPYFNPIGGFWSKIKMVWGFVGNGMMESRITRFGWGGSIAFRKDLIGKKELRIFSNAISDDIAFVHFAKSKGQKVAYASRCKINVNVDEDRKSFWEWANRQTALSVLGNRKLLYVGISMYAASCMLLIFGIVLSVLLSPYYIVLLTPFIIGLYKNQRRTKKHRAFVLFSSFLMNFIFLSNLIQASKMKEIRWRGRTYPLVNPF